MQIINIDAGRGVVVPVPSWAKVVSQSSTEVVIEGDLPPDANTDSFRNRRLQLTFRFTQYDADGKSSIVFSRMALRRIKGERAISEYVDGKAANGGASGYGKWVKTGKWKPYSQGGSVLASRMLMLLLENRPTSWW